MRKGLLLENWSEGGGKYLKVVPLTPICHEVQITKNGSAVLMNIVCYKGSETKIFSDYLLFSDVYGMAVVIAEVGFDRKRRSAIVRYLKKWMSNSCVDMINV